MHNYILVHNCCITINFMILNQVMQSVRKFGTFLLHNFEGTRVIKGFSTSTDRHFKCIKIDLGHETMAQFGNSNCFITFMHKHNCCH